jgi:uncharacterized phage protein (TIGR01671 family)
MSREIKFRAWHTSAKIMSYPNDEGEFEFIAEDGCREASDHDLHGAITNPRIEVMQYTGFKDNNGADIYEGDILDASGVRVVRFGEHEFGDPYEGANQTANGWYTEDKWSNWPLRFNGGIIVGNIHQNPELVEHEQ